MLKEGQNRGVGGMVVGNFKESGRQYEQRLVCCGKKECWCMQEGVKGRDGHGPYWYLCGLCDGKWRRVYLGRRVDTIRFALESGGIDWDAVRKQKGGRRRPVEMGEEAVVEPPEEDEEEVEGGGVERGPQYHPDTGVERYPG